MLEKCGKHQVAAVFHYEPLLGERRGDSPTYRQPEFAGSSDRGLDGVDARNESGSEDAVAALRQSEREAQDQANSPQPQVDLTYFSDSD